MNELREFKKEQSKELGLEEPEDTQYIPADSSEQEKNFQKVLVKLYKKQ